MSQRWFSHYQSFRTAGGSKIKVIRIGLDIAKQIFELHGVDQRERAVLRKTLKRDRVLEYFAQLEPCTVALECRPQKLPAWPETRQIATSLKSGDRNNKTSVDDEILPALAERFG